jgi:hypothetical protein
VIFYSGVSNYSSFSFKSLYKSEWQVIPLWVYPYPEGSQKKYDKIDLYFNGVHPDWQNKGIHSMYYSTMNEVAIERKIHTAITTGQLETNTNAVGIWDNYEREPYLRTRCYIKN